jgi:hypothetical protein
LDAGVDDGEITGLTSEKEKKEKVRTRHPSADEDYEDWTE